jgi:hypothetical protein
LNCKPSENDLPGGWIAVVVLCLLLAATLFGVYEGWTAHSGGIEVPDWGYAFLGVGIVFGLVIGCGLMALAFYSSRRGYEPTREAAMDALAKSWRRSS